MKIVLSTDTLTTTSADLLAIGVRTAKIEKGHVLAALDAALGAGKLEKLLRAEAFTGADGQVLKIPGAGKLAAGQVVLVGLGAGKEKTEDARTTALRAVQTAKAHKRVALLLAESSADAVRLATEGALGGSYRYVAYKTGDRKPKHRVETVELLVKEKSTALKHALARGEHLAASVNFARDLVNAPPNDMHPVALAEAAQREAKRLGLECHVWNQKRIEKAKMELFLAVNRGSAIEPRLVHVAYKPARAKKRVVFVGKGLTFDSGGLCLKPAASMITMKCDMAGAATTLGIVFAAARLGIPVEVHAVVGATENMTGSEAYRPGDVFTSLEGKTVEIINTDAEGRLVLADVLSWAKTLEPDYLVDHATLTGACMVALGPYRAGFFANDDELAKRYLAAAEHEGEGLWRLPLDEELRAQLDSDIADLKHTGGPHGGAITAALFLREFIGKTKWAHLDIAGPAFLDRSFGKNPKGGTGFGISTGVRFLESLVESK
ncbi:MAG: leucyl aminopeptidase [Polyangiales bacterium]